MGKKPVELLAAKVSREEYLRRWMQTSRHALCLADARYIPAIIAQLNEQGIPFEQDKKDPKIFYLQPHSAVEILTTTYGGETYVTFIQQVLNILTTWKTS